MPFEGLALFGFNFLVDAVPALSLKRARDRLMRVLLANAGSIYMILEDADVILYGFPAGLMMQILGSLPFGSWGLTLVGALGMGSAFEDVAFFGLVAVEVEFRVDILLCHHYLLYPSKLNTTTKILSLFQ